MVEEVSSVYDERDLAIEKLRALQKKEPAQTNVDLELEVEEIPAEAPTSKSDLDRWQEAMKKELPPVELAKKFIQQETDQFQLFQAVGELKSQVENAETVIFDL